MPSICHASTLIGSAFAATIAASAPAWSQAAGQSDIVVSGRAAAASSTIDRKSYRIGNDLQAASGSATDVLRNLPGVEVDAQGALSIRGDANVQVLIDGKPSTTMSPANRADALEQLPANTIDHIEVITTPSAQFKPEGSGGIINIITRKHHAPGTTGSISASAGSDGRFNLAANATYRSGRLTATGSVTLHRDMRHRPFTDRRTETDAGAQTFSAQDSLFHGPKLSRIVTASIDYDLTARDRLTASGSYTRRTGTPKTDQHNRVTNPDGTATSDFIRTEAGHESELSDEAALRFRHDFAGKGHSLTLDLRRGDTAENEIRRFTDTYRQPAGLVTIDRQHPQPDELQREFTAEYAVPAWRGKVLLGYDLQRDDDDFRNRGDVIDPLTQVAVTDPAYTNHFRYDQTVHAAYATYDRTLAKDLSAIAGVRLEQTIIHAHQVDLAVTNRQSYFAAYPTLHLQYALSDAQSLKFSYSKRSVRPDPEDLDPFPSFSDPLNLRAGNPQLKPQITQAVEAGYQYEAHGVTAEATVFLRRTRNAFTTVSQFIAPSVLLTTKENLGHSAATGIDLSASGKLSRSISLRLSGTVARNSIDPGNLGLGRAAAILSATAKGGIDFQLGRRDLVQFTANYSGKRLIPQGDRLPSASANIGYRHRFQDGLTAVLSLSDMFDTQRDRSFIADAMLVETSTRRNSRRTLSLALTLPIGVGHSGPDTPIDFAD